VQTLLSATSDPDVATVTEAPNKKNTYVLLFGSKPYCMSSHWPSLVSLALAIQPGTIRVLIGRNSNGAHPA